MKALVLAAGYATRLYPLTKDFPKPLLKVGGRPIIDYIIEKLEKLKEVDEIIVVTNSKFFPLFKKWAGKLKLSKRLSLVNDLTKNLSDRRGAIGDMYFAINKRRIKDSLLVIGADNLFDSELKGFMAFIKELRKNPAIGVFDIGSKFSARKYGVIKLDSKNKIIDFQEKPNKPQSTLVAMCFYYFPEEKLGLLKEYYLKPKFKQDATGFYIDWLRKRVVVRGFVFSGSWFDIGDKKFYQQAQKTYN